MHISIYTDGGAKGNPGPAAIGGAIYLGDRNPDPELNKAPNEALRFRKDIGTATNNEAEYAAVIKALELTRDAIAENKFDKPEKIHCFSDSELLVKQLNGEYKVKQSHIRDLVFKIRVLESELLALGDNNSPQTLVSYTHVRREKNKLADALVNDAV